MQFNSYPMAGAKKLWKDGIRPEITPFVAPALVAPGVTSSATVTANTNSFFGYVTTATGTNSAGCPMHYQIIGAPTWFVMNPSSGNAFGFVPDNQPSFQFTVRAINCAGSNDLIVNVTVTDTPATEFTLRWGRSPKPVLTAREIHDLSFNATFTNVAGHPYNFTPGAGTDYLFIFIGNSAGFPGDRSDPTKGFLDNTTSKRIEMSMDGTYFPGSLAGWRYLDITVDGVPGHLFRSVTQTAADQTWKVVT